MTEQEGIREGILKRLNEFRWELQKPNALINLDTLTALQGAFADQILKDEDSQGVVIKVDRELPQVEGNIGCPWLTPELAQGCCPLIKAGYVAVEPLVKDENPKAKK